MLLVDRLLQKQNRLALVSNRINKLLESGVASYSYSGNSATYIALKDLQTEEAKLEKEIQDIQSAIDSGQTEESTSRGLFAAAFRVR